MRRSLLFFFAATFAARSACAAVITEDEFEDTSLEAGLIARSFAFGLAGYILAPPYNLEDADPAAISVTDLRGYFSYHSPSLRVVLHQSATSTVRSHRSLGFFALGRAGAPPRWLPLRQAVDEPTLTLATETDWAYAAVAEGPLTLTVGRQPVTLGRGWLFKPWDLVSPFTLTEVDTEYKPGVDAVRADLDFSARVSMMLLASGGELEADSDFALATRGSSVVARAKFGWQQGEFALLGGLVRNDAIFGYGALWDLDTLDLYGELTATIVGDDSLSSPAVAERNVPVLRALSGATLRPTAKLTFIPELYYDGFGARRPASYLPVALSERVAVAEQPLLGNLYLGTAIDWEAHPLLHILASSLTNLLDPSELLSLSARYELAANARLAVGGYVPLGERPGTGGLVPESEFGLYPYFGFVELALVL